MKDNTRLTLALFVVSFVGSALILTAGILLFNSYWGDPTIYLIFAKNNAHGDLFSFNPHQFSSGSTSPLWAVLLAIPYIFGMDALGAKAMSLLITIIANLMVIRAVWEFSRFNIWSTIASFFVTEMLTLYGVMMYESSLIVALVAAMLMAGERVAQTFKLMHLQWKYLVVLTIIWSAIPLTRPDATVLVLIQALAIWFGTDDRTRSAKVLLFVAFCAAIPSLLYFGYSFLTLGTLSISSQNRAFALHENAQHFGLLLYSKEAIAYIGSILYILLLAVVGCDTHISGRNMTNYKWFSTFVILSIITYAGMLIFIFPVTSDVPRYFLPVTPLIATAAGIALARFSGKISRRWLMTKIVLILLLIGKPIVSVIGQAFEQRSRVYSFNEIVEDDVVNWVNQMAGFGDRILAYEVQDRYLLRNDLDLMSLDGITDGRVTPYLNSSDILSYLNRYHPHFWIVNSSVTYRPFLQKSILYRVDSSFNADSSLRFVDTAGIRFELLARRNHPTPKSFAGWTYLVRLSYYFEPLK